jgi:hypothetical protein
MSTYKKVWLYIATFMLVIISLPIFILVYPFVFTYELLNSDSINEMSNNKKKKYQFERNLDKDLKNKWGFVGFKFDEKNNFDGDWDEWFKKGN